MWLSLFIPRFLFRFSVAGDGWLSRVKKVMVFSICHLQSHERSTPLICVIFSFPTSKGTPLKKAFLFGQFWILFDLTERCRFGLSYRFELINIRVQSLVGLMQVSPIVRMRNEDMGPPWLKPMLKADYFIPCAIHLDSNKSECNMFCLDCMGNAFCSYCLIQHKDHRVVQVKLFVPSSFLCLSKNKNAP